MVKLERISHFAAAQPAVVTDPNHTRVCYTGLLSAACPGSTAPSKYLPAS